MTVSVVEGTMVREDIGALTFTYSYREVDGIGENITLQVDISVLPLTADSKEDFETLTTKEKEL